MKRVFRAANPLFDISHIRVLPPCHDIGRHSRNTTMLNSEPNERKQPDIHNTYKLNIGRATYVLRDELPLFFEKGLQSTDIYSNKVRFVDPFHTRFRCDGLSYYRLVAEGLRLSMNCSFQDISLDLKAVRQIQTETNPQQPMEVLLSIRWVFEARSRSIPIVSEQNGVTAYEGVFVYKFDKEGKIVEHLVQGIHPTPPMLAPCRWLKSSTGYGIMH